MPLLRGLLVIGAAVASTAADVDAAAGEALLEVSSALESEDECSPDRPDAESCAVNALQRRTSKRELDVSSSEEGCHNMKQSDGGPCWDAMMWVNFTGMVKHPDWYPGLTPATVTIPELQFQAYNSTHPKCPRPCNVPRKAMWCNNLVAPRLWQPAASGPSVEVKVLSYNLFWWHLFKIEGGRSGSAGRLISDNMQPPFDVMGFQECEDPEKVLGPPGLLEEYAAFQGDHAICMAYRKKAWALLAKGEDNVAQDMRTEFYGKRGVQWMRLKHHETGRTLFFMNHHGPLSVNSGGDCGGASTANNLLHVMASKAQVGDLLVLVGDFNANAGSRTIQGLWRHLQQVFNGDSFGGVDNIFSNAPGSGVVATKILGKAGSDHNAVEATVRAGPAREPAPQPAPVLGAEACHTAERGETCWQEVQWAMHQGVVQHPEWYEGLTASSSEEEFQRKVHQESPKKCPMPCTSGAGAAGACHTASQGEACWEEVQWAMHQGIREHPEWYAGLSASSSSEQFQLKVHEETPEKCPMPCGVSAAPGRVPHAVPMAPSAGEVPTGGGMEPGQALRNLEEARGSDGCLIEPNLKYVIAGGWTAPRPGVTDPRVCCRKCQDHGGCQSWTWTDWASEAHGAQCLLHGGGHIVNKVGDDGFVSGLPKVQAVREASSVARAR